MATEKKYITPFATAILILVAIHSTKFGLASEKGTIDPNVTEVRSAESDKYSYRAIIGEKKGDRFFLLEKISRDEKAKEKKVINSQSIFNLSGAEELKLNKGFSIIDLEWRSNGLTFKYVSVNGSIITVKKECLLEAFAANPTVQCK